MQGIELTQVSTGTSCVFLATGYGHRVKTTSRLVFLKPNALFQARAIRHRAVAVVIIADVALLGRLLLCELYRFSRCHRRCFDGGELAGGGGGFVGPANLYSR